MIQLSSRNFIFALTALIAFCTFFELGHGDVFTADEGQRAAPPAEMLRSGDFVMPKLNGKPYLAKPPLSYWIVAGVYTATGVVNEWTARVSTAAEGVIIVLCVYFAFRRAAGESVARWAALMFAASPYLLDRARWANLEVQVWLFTFLAVSLSWHAWTSETAKRRWAFAVLAGMALGAATMTKGPVPYLFLGGGFFAFLAVEGRDADKAIRQGAYWTAAMILLGLVLWALQRVVPPRFPIALSGLILGWVYIAMRNGGGAWRKCTGPLLLVLAMGVMLTLPWAFAVVSRVGFDDAVRLVRGEVAERTYTATEINSGSPLMYFTFLPLCLLPWGFLLPLHLSRKAWAGNGPLYRFAISMGWASVALFSLIAGKEHEYVMPAAPFLLLGTAYHMASAQRRALEGWEARWFAAWRPAALCVLVLAALALPIVAVTRDARPVAMLVEVFAMSAIALALLLARAKTLEARCGRMAVAAGLLGVSWLLVRLTYHTEGNDSPKPLARLCGDIAAANVAIEGTKIYPYFYFYAEHPIRESLDVQTIQAQLTGATPYFYLTNKNTLKALAWDPKTTPGVKFISEPFGPKSEILLGNADPETLLPPGREGRAKLKPL